MKCFYMNTVCLQDDQNAVAVRTRILWKERLETADRMRRKEGRALQLGASYLMSLLLPEYSRDKDAFLRCPPALCLKEHGKPFLKEEPDLYFNLSHSGTYAALCIGHTPNGIDIEHHRKDPKKIAARFFTEEEAAAIENASDSTDLFLRIWTRKEAYLKMTGDGLTREMNTFRVYPQVPAGFCFHELALPSEAVCDYRIAACCRAEEPFEGFREITL